MTFHGIFTNFVTNRTITNRMSMKRFFMILVASIVSVFSVFAEDGKYYFYKVDYPFTAEPFDKTKPNREFKVNDWFVSRDFPDGTESMPYTIDGVKYDLPHNFILVSKQEYEDMLGGKQILNNQKKFLATFEKYPQGQREFWDIVEKRDSGELFNEEPQKKTAEKSSSGMRIVWFILLLIPVLAPIVLLLLLGNKYENRLKENQGPSVMEPWMAIGLCVIETLILLIYAKLNVFTNPNVIPLSNFWMVVIAIVLGYIIMKCMVSFNKTMLGLYKVRISILHGLAIVGIATGVTFLVVIVFMLIKELLHIDTSDDFQMNFDFIAMIVAVYLYLVKVIKKQNNEALVIIIPMVLLSVFGALWLLFIFVLRLLRAYFTGLNAEHATCWDCRFCKESSPTYWCTFHNTGVMKKDFACENFEQDPYPAAKGRKE